MPGQPSLTVLRSQSDERLVQLAREGHERAFEAIVERYRKSLLRACRRLLPEARAEDALQQALLAAWSALQRGDDVRELRPWLYQIVYRTALNALRGPGHAHDELGESLEIADGSEEDLERRAEVRDALTGMAALPERQREALVRTAIGGHSQARVARDLGLTTGAVRQLVHRARARLRGAVTALTPLPVATWLAAAGARSEPLAQRVGEMVAGGAGAGAAAAVAKTGAVALVAGGLLASPAVVDRPIRDERRTPVAQHRAPAAKPPPATRRQIRVRRVAQHAPAPRARVSHRTPRASTAVRTSPALTQIRRTAPVRETERGDGERGDDDPPRRVQQPQPAETEREAPEQRVETSSDGGERGHQQPDSVHRDGAERDD